MLATGLPRLCAMEWENGRLASPENSLADGALVQIVVALIPETHWWIAK